MLKVSSCSVSILFKYIIYIKGKYCEIELDVHTHACARAHTHTHTHTHTRSLLNAHVIYSRKTQCLANLTLPELYTVFCT
jgi:hypothetical protein